MRGQQTSAVGYRLKALCEEFGASIVSIERTDKPYTVFDISLEVESGEKKDALRQRLIMFY